MRRMIALVVAGFLITLTLNAAPSHAAPEMGTTRAGNYFTKHACRGQAAARHWSKVVFHGEETIYLSEVRRRLPEIKRETRKLGRAYHKFGQKLRNPPAAWPASVSRLVRDYARLVNKLGNILTRAGNANSAAQFAGLVNKGSKINFGRRYTKIRARLDLPPRTRC